MVGHDWELVSSWLFPEGSEKAKTGGREAEEGLWSFFEICITLVDSCTVLVCVSKFFITWIRLGLLRSVRESIKNYGRFGTRHTRKTNVSRPLMAELCGQHVLWSANYDGHCVMIDKTSHFIIDIEIRQITAYNSAWILVQKGDMGDGGGVCSRADMCKNWSWQLEESLTCESNAMFWCDYQSPTHHGQLRWYSSVLKEMLIHVVKMVVGDICTWPTNDLKLTMTCQLNVRPNN